MSAASGPLALFDHLLVRRGAVVEFARGVLGRRIATLVRVSDGASLLAVEGGQTLNASVLEVGDAGLVGTMECADSGEMQDGVLGCASECVGISVLAERVKVFAGGRIQGCSISLLIEDSLQVRICLSLHLCCVSTLLCMETSTSPMDF